MTEGENKRLVKKSKNSERMNIKVSTQDKDLLTPDKEINLNISAQKKKTTSKNILTKSKNITEEKIDKNDDIETRISKLIENNKLYQQEIDSIKNEINDNSEKELSEILDLNKQIALLEKEQINLFNENKSLLSNLKSMEEQVTNKFNDKFKVSKVIKRQKQNEIKVDLNKEIKIKEKQKINIEKTIKYNKKDIQILNKLLEENKEGKEQELNKDLSEINDKINLLQTEIEELNKIKLEHKLCQKKENLLKSKLNVLANEIEFESKKSNMIETIEPNKKSPTKIKNVNMTMVYGENVRKNILKNTKNKYNSKIKLVNYKSYNFLLKELNNNNRNKENIGSSYQKLQENNMKTTENVEIPDFSTYLKNGVGHRIDTKSPTKFLFSEQEKDILKKLLPSKYYNNCNEKYNKIENELNEIGEKYKNNDEVKKEIYLDNIKVQSINLRLKELGNIKTNLNAIFSKNKNKIADLKRKIKLLNDEIIRNDAIISNKNKDINIVKKNIEKIDMKYKSILLQTDD